MRTQLLATVVVAGLFAGCAGHGEVLETHHTPYKVPLYSSGAQFGALPPAVQNTVRAEVGTEEIYDIIKDSHSGDTVYRIYFDNPEAYPTLYVARDGSVLNPDLTVAIAAPHDTMGSFGSSLGTAVKLTDLPPAVLEII